MYVISTDSYPHDTVEVDTLVINSGERYDIILYCMEDPEKEQYIIRVRGLGGCINRPIDSCAVLDYGTDEDTPIPTFPAYEDTYPVVS